MKTKLYILTLFVLLSGVTFGQDTINTANLVKGVEISISGIPGTRVDNDLVIIKEQNTYVLTQQEKDSVWNSIYTNTITQNLLKEDPQMEKDKWYLPEHTQNFLAVLNLGKLTYRKKSEVLIKKLYADNEREFMMYGGGGRSSSYRVKIDTIHSKELALRDFIGIVQSQFVNFSKSINGIISFEVDFALDQPLLSANVYKHNPSLLKKTTRKIKRIKIDRIDIGGGFEHYPPNTIIIYRQKK